MFNKQQINALWAKINAKYGPTNESPTHKSSSVSELQTMISEGTLIPGTVYSYDVGTEENSVTIYQKAITPNTLDTNGILVSDNDKYNGVDVDFDVTKCPTDTSLLVIMSSDKSNLYIYENGELTDVAANIGLTDLGDTMFKRIPREYTTPEELIPGTYGLQIPKSPDNIPLFNIVKNNNAYILNLLVDSNNLIWIISGTKFITRSVEEMGLIGNSIDIANLLSSILNDIYHVDITPATNEVTIKEIGNISSIFVVNDIGGNDPGTVEFA